MSRDFQADFNKIYTAHKKFWNIVGTWAIYGEDRSDGLPGNEDNPLICVVEGRFENAVKYAIRQSGFWTYGAGGFIKPLNVVYV